MIVTGYVKSAFRASARSPRLFAGDRPMLVYAPHWQRHRSSWWAWGPQIVRRLAEQTAFGVILAPHQRLAEVAPDYRTILAAVAHLPHVHADIDGSAMVAGSYMAAADLYLGDTSSQIVEFLMRARPCVFLSPAAVDWRASDDHAFWHCGAVVEDLAALSGALLRAQSEHPAHVDAQRAFAYAAFGEVGPQTARAAARAVLAVLR